MMLGLKEKLEQKELISVREFTTKNKRFLATTNESLTWKFPGWVWNKTEKSYLRAISSLKERDELLLALGKVFSIEFIPLDLFKNAPLLTRKSDLKKKKVKNKRKEVALDTTALDAYSAICKIEEELRNRKKIYRKTLEEEIQNEFFLSFLKEEQWPKPFTGISGQGSCTCILRNHTTETGLQKLRDFGIPLQEEVIVPEIPEAYLINPQLNTILENHPSLREKISQLLSAIPEFKGVPAIVKQEAQEGIVQHVLTEESYDHLFTQIPKKQLPQVLSEITSLQIRSATFLGTSQAALDHLSQTKILDFNSDKE